MSNYYLSHSAAELDEAVEKVLTGYKDVSSVTATGNDVVIGKTIVDSSGNVINGSLNTDQFYSEGYTAGVIDGNNTSYSRGYDEGYDEGYDTGYDKGLEDATPTLQSKEVIPSLVEQTITADTGFDGLLSVYVKAIPQSILDAEYQRGYDESKPYKQELSYIQSNGVQYINTSFTPNQNTRIVIDFEILSGNTAEAHVCSVRTNASTPLMTLFYNANGTMGTRWGTGASKNFSGVSGANRYVFDRNKNVCTVNGANAVTVTLETFTVAYPLVLFCRNDGTAQNAFIKGRLYSCQIYDNGTLVRDYIPVLDLNSVPCLYDKIGKTLYHNSGSGTFTYA